ncbi:MAG: YciI family protein [Deltaproteobacteria bacterium]|nr:YciI family protein [Deltaproteobacteria bacterium]
MQFFVYFTMTEGQRMSPPNPEGMAALGKLMQESMRSGLIVATGQLGQSTTHVRLEQGAVSVTDGPFIEGKELIPGFTVIEVDSKQDGIEWVTKLRRCMGEGTLRMAPIHVGKFDD